MECQSRDKRNPKCKQGGWSYSITAFHWVVGNGTTSHSVRKITSINLGYLCFATAYFSHSSIKHAHVPWARPLFKKDKLLFETILRRSSTRHRLRRISKSFFKWTFSTCWISLKLDKRKHQSNISVQLNSNDMRHTSHQTAILILFDKLKSQATKVCEDFAKWNRNYNRVLLRVLPTRALHMWPDCAKIWHYYGPFDFHYRMLIASLDTGKVS